MPSFDPRKYERIQTTLWMDERMLKQVEDMASNVGISRNACLVQCIAYALSHRQAEEPSEDSGPS